MVLSKPSKEALVTELVEFWSSKDTAEFLGVPEATVRYWNWQRIGPRSYKIGRFRKYKPADVRRWAEQHASEPRRA